MAHPPHRGFTMVLTQTPQKREKKRINHKHPCCLASEKKNLRGGDRAQPHEVPRESKSRAGPKVAPQEKCKKKGRAAKPGDATAAGKKEQTKKRAWGAWRPVSPGLCHLKKRAGPCGAQILPKKSRNTGDTRVWR